MKLQQNSCSIDSNLPSAVAALRADLMMDYVVCKVRNIEQFPTGACTIGLHYSNLKNLIQISVMHRPNSNAVQPSGVLLGIYRHSAPFLKQLIQHTNPKVIINLKNILSILQHVIEQLDKIIANDEENKNNWPTFQRFVSRIDLASNLLSAAESEEVSQLLEGQQQSLITLKAKLTEHLVVFSKLQTSANQPSIPIGLQDAIFGFEL